MESTPSSYDNTFYCPACKQEYPFASKEYHNILCGGGQCNQSNNNNIKNDFCLLSEVFSNNNAYIDINSAPYYPQEDNKEEQKESVEQPQYPVWKEEYEENKDVIKKEEDFEDLQPVLNQIRLVEDKKEEEPKREEKKEEQGILSKLQEYGSSIKEYGVTIGKVGAGIGLCAFGSYIGSPAVVNFGLSVIANHIDEKKTDNQTDNISNSTQAPHPSENVNNNDEIEEQYRIERELLEREAQERERREKEERERRQRENRQRQNNYNRHEQDHLDSESIRQARILNLERYGQLLNDLNGNRDDELANIHNVNQFFDLIYRDENFRGIRSDEDISLINNNILRAHEARENEEEEDIINLLPVTEIKDNEHKPKGDCTICLAEFSVKEKVTSLPCLHIFHNQCIKEWLKEHNVCPVCKLALNSENLGLE